MNIKFYLVVTSFFLVTILGGFYTGLMLAKDMFFSTIRDSYGETSLVFVPYAIFFSLSGSLIGLLVSAVLANWLGRRWRDKLNFGSHPVLKLTTLAFFTFIVFLFGLIWVYSFLNP